MNINKIKSHICKFLSNTITHIITILLIPIIILISYASSSTSYHTKVYEDLLISNYVNELNLFLNHTEQKLNTIINTSYFLASNPSIANILTTKTIPSDKHISSHIATLKQTSLFTDITDDIAIYNKDAGFVLSSTGLYTPYDYFNNICSYQDYNLDYWLNYHTIMGDKKVLNPTFITSNSPTENQAVVPMVFTSLNNIISSSIVIFNINVNSIAKELDIHKLTTNSQILMKDNAKGNIYSLSQNINDITNSVFLHTIKESLHSTACIISHDNKKFLLIQSTDRANFWGYSYFVLIPYTDIHNATTKIFTNTLTFLFIMIILLLFYVVYGSKHLYKPWQKIISTTRLLDIYNEKPAPTDNATDYVLNTILDISDLNKDLHDSLKATLPLSQEKYLIDILNNNIHIAEEQNNLLELLAFEYDYFMAIAISIKISSSFFAEQKILNPDNIMQKKIYRVIQSFFIEKYPTYELPASNDIFYILLNIETENQIAEINNITEEIKNIIAPDNDNLNIIITSGNIYHGFDGLKLTHQEAISAISRALNRGKIYIPTSLNSNYIFSQNCENILINYLSIGSNPQAKVLLTDIFDKIQQESAETKKQIYNDIINTFKKTMMRNNFPEANSYIKPIFNMLQECSPLQDVKIQAEILYLTDTITNKTQSNSKTVKIEEIIDYINEHYAENIYLEELADKFNTSPKYLSKKISAHLNMPFKEYITQLKINKAKGILETSNINISDVCTICGFQDRGAFTRAFKLQTGISPSVYRKNFNKNSNSELS